MPSIVVPSAPAVILHHLRRYFYTQANKTPGCTDFCIISEICKFHSLTFPSNFSIPQLDFSMPLAPSFILVFSDKLLPFAMWSSLTSRTTMGAVWPCLLPGLGHPQLVNTGLAFSVVGTDFAIYPLSCGCSFMSIACFHNCEMKPTWNSIRFNPFRMRSADSPTLAIVQAV